MGRFELEQARNESQDWALTYEAREREFNDMADVASDRLAHVNEQLELARQAKEQCETTQSSQVAFFGDVETYAARMAAALGADGGGQALVSCAQGSDSDAQGAVREATELVNRLEQECFELNAEIDDYRQQAQEASQSAQECWDNVACLQEQIDHCED